MSNKKSPIFTKKKKIVFYFFSCFFLKFCPISMKFALMVLNIISLIIIIIHISLYSLISWAIFQSWYLMCLILQEQRDTVEKKIWDGRKINICMLLRSLAKLWRSLKILYIRLQILFLFSHKDICVLSQNFVSTTSLSSYKQYFWFNFSLTAGQLFRHNTFTMEWFM